MRVLIAGGGTGGHVFPALSIAEAIKAIAPGTEVAFAGRNEGLEANILSKKGFRFYPVSTGQIRGMGFTALKSALYILKGIFESIGILMGFKPHIVVGVGGYVMLPVGVASVMLRKKVVLHEQNSVPGSSNRLLGKFATKIFTGFEEAGAFFSKEKTVYTGNPVRYELVKRAFDKRKMQQKDYNLLVLGGSSGAVCLNALAVELVRMIVEKGFPFRVYHQTGNNNYEEMKRAYDDFEEIVHYFPFAEDIGRYYEIADFAVARAGAVTISEISCFGIPVVLIPYPYAADSHQEKNALGYVKIGCGLMMKEDELNPEKIMDYFLDLSKDEKKYEGCRMSARKFSKPFAADEIARMCLELA